MTAGAPAYGERTRPAHEDPQPAPAQRLRRVELVAARQHRARRRAALIRLVRP